MKGIYYFNGKDITMNIRLCRIPKIRFGQSRRDISRTGSMKNRSKKNCSQTKFLYTMFQRELPYNRGSSFF